MALWTILNPQQSLAVRFINQENDAITIVMTEKQGPKKGINHLHHAPHWCAILEGLL